MAKHATNSNLIRQDTSELRKLLEKSQKPNADIPEILFNDDTLKIVTGITYLYYPFGKHSDIKDIEGFVRTGIVKKLSLKNLLVEGNSAQITQISTKNSIVKFTYDEETLRQEIVSAIIRDNNFPFIENIRIGMSKEDFLSLLFNHPPKVPEDTIKLISLVEGIKHYYIFAHNKLSEIRMVTDYQIANK